MKCLECNKECKSINLQHLKKCCKLTPDEYKKKHGVVFLIEENTRKSFGLALENNNNWRGGKTYRACSCGKRLSKNAKGDCCRSCVRSEYSNEIKEKVILLFKQGKSNKEISKETGMTSSPISRLLKNYRKENLVLNNSEIFTVKAKDIWQFYTGGKEYYTWVKNRIKKHKLKSNIDFLKIEKNEINSRGMYVTNVFFTESVAEKVKEGDQYIIKQSKADILYFISAPSLNLIKIGVTNNIKLRYNTLSNMSPVKLEIVKTINTEKAKDIELELHEKFKTLNDHGEWFIFDNQIKKFIEENG